MLITLTRIRQNEQGTLGVLTGEPFSPFYTLEPVIPKIPVGFYECEPFPSAKFGMTWKLKNVPGATDIEFHWGGEVEDTKGCILLSNRYITVEKQLIFTASRLGFEQFRRALQLMAIKNFELEVR